MRKLFPMALLQLRRLTQTRTWLGYVSLIRGASPRLSYLACLGPAWNLEILYCVLLTQLSHRSSGTTSQPLRSTAIVTPTTYRLHQHTSTHTPISSSPPLEPAFDHHLVSHRDGRSAMQNTRLGEKVPRRLSLRNTRIGKEVVIV